MSEAEELLEAVLADVMTEYKWGHVHVTDSDAQAVRKLALKRIREFLVNVAKGNMEDS